MDKPVHLVEFETMLLSRYTVSPRYRSENGLPDRSVYLLLNRLAMEGPMSIKELSEAFRLDASTLNRQTGALLRAQLVERIPDPGGGIARKFRLTETGRRQLESSRAAHLSGLEKVLTDWTAAEVDEFAAYLRRFNNGIENLDGRPWPRPDA